MAQADPGRTIPALLASRAEAWPAHGYLWLEDGEARETRLDYGALKGRVEAIAAGLAARGAKGDRVLIILAPGIDYILAVLATMSAGMIAVPVYPPDPANQMMGLAQVKAVIEDSTPRLGLTSSAVAPLVKVSGDMEPVVANLDWLHLDVLEAQHAGAVPERDVAPDDVAVLLYTSGSTGAPKGVMLSHGNLADTAAAMAEDCRLDATGRLCVWIPGYHVSGLFAGIILPLWAGAVVVGFSPRHFVERPRRWLEAIFNHQATLSGAPTFAYDVIGRAIRPDDLGGLDLSRWASAVVGGEAIRPEVIEGFARLLAPTGFRREAIYTMFGQTEAAMITTGNGYLAGPESLALDPEALRQGQAVTVEGDRPGTRVLIGSGKALPGMGYAIVDPADGKTLPDLAVGEIWLSGPGVGKGYWGKAQASRETFQAMTADGDGPYLRTGDLGFRANGQVHVVGRIKEVIILRGLKFYPDDLEATALGADPALAGATASAFGFTGSAGEELLAIAMETKPIEDEAARLDLAAAIRRAIAASWAVQVNAVMLCAPGQLPRTRTAKVQRTQCAALLENGTWQPVGGLLGMTAPVEPETPVVDLASLSPEEFVRAVPDELKRLFAWRLGMAVGQVSMDRAIGDFGIDSMAVVQLSLDIWDRFHVNLTAEDLRGDNTLAGLGHAILARRRAEVPPAPMAAGDRRLRNVVLGISRRITKVEVSGREHLPLKGPAILVANHVNSLEMPLLADLMPQERPMLVASAHLAQMPVHDRLLRALFRPLYIDMSLALSFVDAIEALRQGEIVGIAPEGRLNTDGVLGEAKPGAAYLAAVSGAPVIPVAISGHVGWKRRLLGLKPLPIRIECGAPMRFTGMGEGDLTRNTETIMRAIAAMLPAAYRGRWSNSP